MSDNLFERVACFTDIHFGLRHNSRKHNDDCEDFIKWFIKEAQERDCETCIFLGDFHHHRSSINVSTLNYSMSNLKRLSNNFKKVYLITGNHDIFYRERREINSLIISSEIHNIVLIDRPFTQGDVALVPWLVEDEWKTVKKIKSKYMFGHFEIPGFKMNAQITMPEHGQINSKHFTHQDYVFSGHFHKRQNDSNIHYIGNPFSHNFADAGDFDRGAMFLKWNGVPEYVNYTDGPRHIACYLTELLENSEDYLRPKTSVKVTLDTNITYEEANFIRELYIENHDIRDLKFVFDAKEELDQEFEGEITFQTVDQIVIEQLSVIDSNTFDPHVLVDIYKNL